VGGMGEVVFGDDGSATISGYTFSSANPREISMMIVTNELVPNAGNKLVEKMKNELGVTINYDIVTTDMQDTRIGTYLAGGTYADIVAQGQQRADMITGGALVRLDEYLDSGKFPLLLEHIAPFRNKLSWSGGEVPNGFYIFPDYNRFYNAFKETTPWGAPGFWLQKDVLASLNYPSTSELSIEEYFKIIEDYVAANPTIDGVPTIGFLIPMWTGQEWAFFNHVALVQGSPNDGGVFVDNKFGPGVPTARLYLNDDYAYRYLKLLNEVDKKGLIDRSTFYMTQDEFFAKVASGAVVGFGHQRWAFGGGQDPLVAEGRYERTYVPTAPTFDGIQPWYMNYPVMNVQEGFGISVSCEDPEMIMAFLEVMMTERWQKILFWGLEGEDYLVNADGIFYLTQEMRDEQQQLDWRMNNQLRAFRDRMPKREGTWEDGNPDTAGRSTVEFYEALSDYDKDFMSQYGYTSWSEFLGTWPQNPDYFPAWQAGNVGALSQEATEADTTFTRIRIEYYPQLVLCDPADFDNIWAEYLAQFERPDVAEQVEIYLKEMNAYIASFYQ
jgi:putative aldouronate transport system substrate-binding protein